jgi:predicted transcriptional regulator of viral defense system
MPVIKYSEKMKRILMKPVFTEEDMRAEGIGKNYSKKLLFTLAKSRKIKRIERGKYSCLDDPVAVAAHITNPCYLSLWTAMSIRNLTDQIPFAVEVVTSRRRFKNNINFEGTPIIFYTAEPKMMFGYENMIWKENIRIAVANVEKIIIDAVYFNNMPEEETAKLIKSADLRLLEKYSSITGNKKIESSIREMIECSHQRK